MQIIWLKANSCVTIIIPRVKVPYTRGLSLEVLVRSWPIFNKNSLKWMDGFITDPLLHLARPEVTRQKKEEPDSAGCRKRSSLCMEPNRNG